MRAPTSACLEVRRDAREAIRRAARGGVSAEPHRRGVVVEDRPRRPRERRGRGRAPRGARGSRTRSGMALRSRLTAHTQAKLTVGMREPGALRDTNLGARALKEALLPRGGPGRGAHGDGPPGAARRE
jgi:hypothetical protein